MEVDPAMITRLLIGAGIIVGVGLMTRQVRHAEPMALARVMLYGFLALLFGIFVFLLAEQQWVPSMVMALCLFPGIATWQWVNHYLKKSRAETAAFSRAAPDAAAAAGDALSRLETRYLSMTLNPETGEIRSRVRRGLFRGNTLEALSQADLQSLIDECRTQDPPSVAILETFMMRAFSLGDAAAREDAADHMSPVEAYDVLGLTPGAAPERVRQAHRRLMQQAHPDRGGSTHQAAKINHARDVLLAR